MMLSSWFWFFLVSFFQVFAEWLRLVKKLLGLVHFPFGLEDFHQLEIDMFEIHVFVRRQLLRHVQTFAEQGFALDRIALLAKENSQIKERVRDQRVFFS